MLVVERWTVLLFSDKAEDDVGCDDECCKHSDADEGKDNDAEDDAGNGAR